MENDIQPHGTNSNSAAQGCVAGLSILELFVDAGIVTTACAAYTIPVEVLADSLMCCAAPMRSESVEAWIVRRGRFYRYQW